MGIEGEDRAGRADSQLLGRCPSTVRCVFPMLVFQLSKQQNCTQTTSSTVLGTHPNCTRTKTWWEFRAPRKDVYPPPHPIGAPNSLQIPAPAPPPLLSPPSIFNRNRPRPLPFLAPRTLPSPPPRRKYKKYPKRPARRNSP